MNILELQSEIGGTPLQRLGETNIYAKLEKNNPAGSIKDRAAFFMIKGAIERGELSEGGVIIEPTSGNTGIAIAYIAQKLGYKAIIVMPDSMTKERIAMMESYGARVELTKGSLGMQGAIDRAEELKREIKAALYWDNLKTSTIK